jgi:hypothetical protein
LGSFSILDLERLKDNDAWLSDSHVTLGLQWVLLVLVFLPSKPSSDCFQDCLHRNVWGTTKIKLLDTSFWDILSDSPERYGSRFQKKLNLLDYDFIVMPMFKV